MAEAAGNESLYYVARRASSLLEELNRDLPNFENQMLPDFIVLRTKCVRTIEELKEKIEYVCMGGSGGRLAGSLTAIVGSLTTVFGIAMTLTGKANGGTVMNAGNGLSLLGGATSASATLIELGLTQKYLNEIKQVLKADQELTETMLPTMNRSRALNLLLMKLFGYSILTENGRTIILVCYECFKILRAGDRTLINLIREIEESKQIHGATGVIPMSVEVAKKVVECLRTLMAQPELLESYRNICSLMKGNPQVFELAKFSLQMFLQFRSLVGVDTVASLLSLAGPTVSNGALLAQGGFHSIMIALNVVSVVFAARDIQLNTSKYSEHLDQIKAVLSAELRAVTDLHRTAIES